MDAKRSKINSRDLMIINRICFTLFKITMNKIIIISQILLLAWTANDNIHVFRDDLKVKNKLFLELDEGGEEQA